MTIDVYKLNLAHIFLWADTWPELQQGTQISSELDRPQPSPAATSALELWTLRVSSAACKSKGHKEPAPLPTSAITQSSR